MSNMECHALLEQQLQVAAKPSLLIVDENTAFDQLPKGLQTAQQSLLTNRWDIGRALREQGALPECSDYEFATQAPSSLHSIVYRLSKEKAVVHRVINRSGELLVPGGELILIGHKQEGLLSYGKRASRYLGGESCSTRGAHGYTALHLQRCHNLGDQLPDDNYPELRPCISIEGLSLFSKPGLYGWQKIDRGSMLLIQALRQLTGSKQTVLSDGDILDLGCGYGLLSVLAAKTVTGQVVATDNNFAAVAACSRNFVEHKVRGEVIADDCARHINQRFDLVLCNPPFHQGFDTSQEMTARFTEQAALHLKHSGSALFVVNQFVGIERHAQQRFTDVQELLRQDGFKVLRLRHPRRSKRPSSQ